MLALDDIYLFRHAAYRDVAYELQLPSDRARMHARALEITEQLFKNELHLVAAELAVHARLAQTDAQPEVADKLAKAEFRYLLIQLAQDHQRAQWASAMHAADRALHCAGRSEADLAKVLTLRGSSLEALGRRDEATEAWLALADWGKRHSDNHEVVAGLCGAALCQANLGRHDEAEGLFGQATAYADQPALRAKLTMDRAMLSNARGDFVENERLLMKALELSTESDAAFCRGLRGNIANMYGLTGRRQQAIAEFIALAEEFRQSGGIRGEGTCHANLGRQYLLAGDLAAAAVHLRRGIELASEIGIQRSVAFAQANLAEVESQLGKLDEALALAENARDLATEQGLPVYHAAYQCTLAQIHVMLGHEQLASDLVESARIEFLAVNGHAFVAEYCNPVRLRIAAWRAVSTPEVGRKTSRLRASPPATSWLPVIHVLLHELEESIKARGPAGSQMEQPLKAGRRLLTELEAAVTEQRPALVFRGYLPDELLPDARKALMQRLIEHSPAAEAALKTLHPALWKALSD